MHYRATFKGRQVGALGITYRIAAEVTAANPVLARLALYERFERISGLVLAPCDGIHGGRDPEGPNLPCLDCKEGGLC